jgi:hypothetical protein
VAFPGATWTLALLFRRAPVVGDGTRADVIVEAEEVVLVHG